jgi:predicted TIM-barrel fold metal-dependent hydrolase
MEDERTQHPLMLVPPVDIAPLADVVRGEPRVKLVILNSYPQLPINRLRPLSSAGRIYFDLSMVERVGGIGRLGAQVSPERVVFGSYYPFFVLESALLKLEESGLTESQRAPIISGNARQLLGQ